MPKVTTSAGAYYAIQALAVFGWWAVLYLRPETRTYFVLEPNSETSLMAFWVADLAFIGTGSLAASIFCFSRNDLRYVASWFVTGAVSYAAVYCSVFTLMTDKGWLGMTLMLPAMILSGVFAVGMSFEKTMFREAKDASSAWIVTKTVTQIVVVWSIILVAFPWLITALEDKLGIPRLSFPFQGPVAIVLFVLISSLGVGSAVVMSRIGRGTPLPLDHARKLVISGPYAYVRNPMAVSGIGQGLAVALFLGSPLVAIYALMGSAIWQFIFRPLEEGDLRVRFGDEYERYLGEVKCWVPRLKPYR